MSGQEVATITQIVQNVGFPIAAFLLLYRFIDKTMKSNTEAVNKLEQAITKLCEKVP